MSLLRDFRDFAFKGNMIDLAVAVVIGAAFTKLITSVVDNIIMPLLSYVTPEQSYTEWMIGRIKVGAFLGDFVSFLILALVVFIVIVKAVGWLAARGREKAPVGPPPLTKDQELLMEIRDLLTRQAQTGH